MINYARSDNAEIIGKLNTLTVDSSGWYIFKVSLSSELYALVKDKDISGYKFYGLSGSNAEVSSAAVSRVLDSCELLSMSGEKVNSFGGSEFLMAGFINSVNPFSVYLAKVNQDSSGDSSSSGGGCNSGIMTGAAAILVLLAVKFRKH